MNFHLYAVLSATRIFDWMVFASLRVFDDEEASYESEKKQQQQQQQPWKIIEIFFDGKFAVTLMNAFFHFTSARIRFHDEIKFFFSTAPAYFQCRLVVLRQWRVGEWCQVTIQILTKCFFQRYFLPYTSKQMASLC